MKRALKDQRKPSKLSGAHLQSIAIVVCAEPAADFEVAKKLRKDLYERGLRKVDLFVAYSSRKAAKASEEKDIIPFAPDSFNWIGRIASSDLTAALKQEYQVLMDLTEGRSFPADVLITKLHVQWKVGRHLAQREYLLDLMIDTKDQDLNKLIQHMDHYLNTLNKPTAA